jgi:uncharacterized membrane protein
MLIHVLREVVVGAPPEVCYREWRNLEHLAGFTKYVEAVRDLDANVSHWKARGPLGTTVQWYAETTVDEPGKKIAWRSTRPEHRKRSDVDVNGEVRFEPAGAGATRITCDFGVNPPAGTLGKLIAEIFSNPEDMVERDLDRFKRAIEQRQARAA